MADGMGALLVSPNFGDDGTLPVVGDWSGGKPARPGFSDRARSMGIRHEREPALRRLRNRCLPGPFRIRR